MKHVMIFLSVLSVICFCWGPVGFGVEEGWISLFNGEDFEGWRVNENPGSFIVLDGVIVCNGPRAHLFYSGETCDAAFKNFEFKVNVMTKPGANSGIYIHTKFQESGWPSTGYEIQVNNSQAQHGDYKELKKTGSLYGIRNVYKSVVKDNEWFNVHITVVGKRIQIRVNDTLLVDYTEPAQPVRDDYHKNWRLSRGTFAFQAHDPESTAMYKNIRVKPLPDDLESDGEPPVVDDRYKQIIQLSGDNFPVLDLHTHLKGGLTIEEALENSRKVGIFYGVAPNCGLGFPIQDDAGIDQFIEEMKDKPVFLGMQAEGREWVNMFSKEAIAKFDYVFTDAMTFTDDSGKRIHLWIPAEVEIDDKQAFMEMYVKRIESVLSDEPINIYVNPTFLPACISEDYDELWTEERMMKVINAAVKNKVAIEINARYRLPSAAFIKRAKKAGVKFTMGTNNGGPDLGRLEYSLDMVKECGLTWQDMYVPGS